MHVAEGVTVTVTMRKGSGEKLSVRSRTTKVKQPDQYRIRSDHDLSVVGVFSTQEV